MPLFFLLAGWSVHASLQQCGTAMFLREEGRVVVRGYLGIHLLARTTTWIRVGTEESACRATL